MSADEKSELLKLVEAASAKLAEHFDGVQICATHNLEGQTTSYVSGHGNIHARIGVLREWVIRQEQYVKTDADYYQKKDLE